MATKKIFVKLLFLSILKDVSGSNWVIGGSNMDQSKLQSSNCVNQSKQK